MRGIVFDMDGTLTDTNELYSEAYIRGFERAGIKVRDNPHLEQAMWSLYGRSPQEIVEGVLKEAGVPVSRTNEVLEMVFTEMEQTLSGRDVLYPGVSEALEILSKSHRLGLVTGSPERIARAAMKQAINLFGGIVCGDREREWKPSPGPLLKCARLLGLPPEECAYVGDTPVDMEAAKRAGMLPVGVLTGPFSREELENAGARIVIESAARLPLVMDRLK